MPTSFHTRTSVALVFFAIAAAAGWISVSPPVAEKGRAVTIVSEPLSPQAAKDPPAPQSSGSALAAVERSLVSVIDPSAEIYTGERLADLCRMEFATDVPGSNEAFSYARRWAMHSPQAMYDWFQKRGGFSLPNRAQNSFNGFEHTVFSEWAKRDAAAAIKAALGCATKGDRSSAVMTVIGALRKTDPERAFSLAVENIDHFSSGGTLPFSAYGEDYEETWAFLCKLPAGKIRGSVLARYFDDVVRYHGADTARLWQEMPAAVRQELVAGGFTGQYLGGKSLEASAAPATLEGLEDLRRTHAEATGDAGAALRLITGSSGRDWAQRDPATAIAWSLQHLKGEQRVTTTASLFSAGAAHNFDATLQTWQSLPDGMLRARAAGNLAAGAPPERKAEADAVLAALPEPDRILAEDARKNAVSRERNREQWEQNRERLQRAMGK